MFRAAVVFAAGYEVEKYPPAGEQHRIGDAHAIYHDGEFRIGRALERQAVAGMRHENTAQRWPICRTVWWSPARREVIGEDSRLPYSCTALNCPFFLACDDSSLPRFIGQVSNTSHKLAMVFRSRSTLLNSVG